MTPRSPVDVAIAVWDPVHSRAERLREVLSSYGFHAATPSDVRTWSPDNRERIVIVGVLDEVHLGIVADLSFQASNGWIRVVAQPPGRATGLVAETIAAGATVVVPRELPPAHVVETVWELVRGRALMPLTVLDAIAEHAVGDMRAPGQSQARPTRPQRDVRLTDRQCRMLRLLTDGRPVAEIAVALARSRRQLHRDLRSLYRELGVENRSQAIAAAAATGLVKLAPLSEARG